MLFADTMGQLVNHTSFQFSATVLTVFPWIIVCVIIVSFLSETMCDVQRREGRPLARR